MLIHTIIQYSRFTKKNNNINDTAILAPQHLSVAYEAADSQYHKQRYLLSKVGTVLMPPFGDF